jgi:hypothetical protein
VLGWGRWVDLTFILVVLPVHELHRVVDGLLVRFSLQVIKVLKVLVVLSGSAMLLGDLRSLRL